MTIIIVTFYYPVNQNPGWGSGWAWVWIGLPVVYIFNMATRSIYSPSPPLTDLNGLAEKFKKRGYRSVVLPRKFTLSRIERVAPSDCSFPLFVIPGLTRNPVFLSLKDQKIVLLEQRVSNLEVVLVLCSYAMRYLSSEVP